MVAPNAPDDTCAGGSQQPEAGGQADVEVLESLPWPTRQCTASRRPLRPALPARPRERHAPQIASDLQTAASRRHSQPCISPAWKNGTGGLKPAAWIISATCCAGPSRA